MKRNIIKIDSEKCNGCGICVDACHEGALAMIDGKAVLISDNYCDGLGDCLPECPTGAIEIVQKQVAPYNKAAVDKRMQIIKDQYDGKPSNMLHENGIQAPTREGNNKNNLQSWPLQIKLVSPAADFFDDCELLIAADCTAFAYVDFHKNMLAGRVCLIGCPKLDEVDYSEKLTDIIVSHNIKSITVLRMEVPCCGGISYAVENAISASGKDIPLNIRTVALNGELV